MATRGYKAYQLQKDTAEEKRQLQEDLEKQNLWSTVGSSLGGLLAMVPGVGWGAAALLGGIGSLAGRGIGSAIAGDVTSGKFYKGARADAVADKKFFSEEAVGGALQAALLAGTGAYAKEYASASEAAKTAAATEATTSGVAYTPPDSKKIKDLMTDPWDFGSLGK
tara:strand:+ start:181 stop:678 length:498 start_codon:yes stop_codon:yes gene_type:complete